MTQQISGVQTFNDLTAEDIRRLTGIRHEELTNKILAIWNDSAATSAPSASHPQPSEFGLYEDLKKLLPAQLSVLEPLIGVPPENRTPDTLPIGDRAIALLRHLRQKQGGIDRLRAALDEPSSYLL